MRYRVRDGQDAATLRHQAYPREREQLGAFAKILRSLIEALPPDVRATMPPDAIAILDQIEGVKAKYPKRG